MNLLDRVPPISAEALHAALADIVNEIERVDRKARAGDFGGRHIIPDGDDDARLRVLVEEVGEVARELNERDNLTLAGVSGLRERLRVELIQVAATAAGWAAALTEEEEGYR